MWFCFFQKLIHNYFLQLDEISLTNQLLKKLKEKKIETLITLKSHHHKDK